ncbi:MAG: hypothetical protein HQ559_02345 [Lentisphaerae bacterium]|nr:hypothetical protein [Lentisphaerota bacterium]
MRLATIAAVILAVVMTGCSVQVKMNKQNETEMGSHSVVVKPGAGYSSSSSSSSGDSETYHYKCGDTSIEIVNEELIVNNVRYGKLADGVDILVDQGVVSVAGEKRSGTPMSPEEIMDAAPVKETTKELNGYAVTVRPGESFSSTTHLFGKHTLTVGNTKVAIKDDGLFVNGTSFGSLKQGDTILVEAGNVSVSGEARQPSG